MEFSSCISDLTANESLYTCKPTLNMPTLVNKKANKTHLCKEANQLETNIVTEYEHAK